MPTNLNYWASETNQRRLIERCLDRVSWGLAALQNSGALGKMLGTLSAYYGHGTDGFRTSAELIDTGDVGEVTEMHVNSLKPIAQNTLSIIAGTRPAIKPVATNGDSASAAQTRLAMGLHEYYDRRVSAKALEIETVRGGVVASRWSLLQGWKATAGEAVTYDVDRDQLIYEGDIELFTVPPWRITYEPCATNDAERRWCIFKRKYSRHDLIARAKDPYVKDCLIRGITADMSAEYSSRLLAGSLTGTFRMLDRLLRDDINVEDEVWVWELRHLPSPALPLGRLVRFVEPKCVLFDSMAAGEPVPQVDGGDEQPPAQTAVRYPYDELHAYEWCPERVVGTTDGHTSMFDLTGLVDFIDMCTTSIATTVNLNGHPHLWSPGGDVNVRTIDGGPTVLETPQKPEVLDFPALKPEVIEAANWAKELMNAAAALNATVMGNPEKGMPASAQALQRAQAVQYHQVAQDEWIRLIERNANGRLRLLKRFARTERVAEIAGESGGWEVRKWKAEDIAGVERFAVEPINPMSATFEGRQAIAEQLGIQGDALLDFITTGSMKKVTETRTLQLELVERNKSLLLRGVGLAPVDQAASMQAGQPVFVEVPKGQEVVTILRSDPHHIAIPAYLSVVNSPESRTDNALVQPALDCVQESLRLWMTLTPDECQAFGIPPLPSILAAQQAAAMVPQAPPAPAPANDNTEAPSTATPEGQPGQADLPEPPPTPIEGTDAPESLSLGA